jgi:hypothetical protein
MWANTRMRVMLMSLCSLISSCGIMNSCSDIIECVVYVVSCVGCHFFQLLGTVDVPLLWFSYNRKENLRTSSCSNIIECVVY